MRFLLVLAMACFLLTSVAPAHADPDAPCKPCNPCTRNCVMLGLGAAVLVGVGVTALIISQVSHSKSAPTPMVPHAHS